MEPTVRERRTPPAALGQLLAAARMRRGWRRRAAERQLGIASGYLARIEMGARCPSRAMAEHLARVLELTEDERAELSAYMDEAWGGTNAA